MNEQRNLLLAVVLSVMIVLAWPYLLPPPEAPQQTATSSGQSTQSGQNGTSTPQPGSTGTTSGQATVPGAGHAAQTARPRSAVIASHDRITIASDRLQGSIRLTGARLDDLTLLEHQVTAEAGSDPVTLFSPPQTANPYYAEFGWSIMQDQDLDVPNNTTVWTADGSQLTPEIPVTLTWDNGQGLLFTRTISMDADYMITIEQTITNNTDQIVSLFPYGLISRTGTPKIEGLFILHEGPLGVFDSKLEELDYDTLQEDGSAPIRHQTRGGWLGITDKYWLAALVPDQTKAFKGSFTHHLSNGQDRYQTDFIYDDSIAIAPGTSESITNNLFAGAKEVNLLDRYAEEMNIINFDLAIDFGWFYWITKPLFHVLHFFFVLLGNFGLAIIAVTILVKLAFFPLANTSYKAMARMRKLQPRMLELREKYGDDRQQMSQEMMKMYQQEKVNPMAGCFPILIQIPVFFALYKVLYVTIEMRHAPFYGWIKDMSAPDPTTFWNLFGLIPWDPSSIIPDFLSIGVLPIVMGVTMYLQQKLNPQPMDEMQQRIFTIMPFFFTFLLAPFSAGLVLYWTVNNILSIAQQWVIMKRDNAI